MSPLPPPALQGGNQEYEPAVVKLSRDGAKLAGEHGILALLEKKAAGCFVRPLCAVMQLHGPCAADGTGMVAVSLPQQQQFVRLAEHADFRDKGFVAALVLQRGKANMRDYLRDNGGLTVGKRRAIAERVIQIVEACHEEAAVVWMDLKAANLVLVDTVSGDSVFHGIDMDSTFKAGALLPSVVETTSAIMAPELLPARRSAGQTADCSMDIWSLGIVIFHVMTGQDFWSACFDIHDSNDSLIQAKLAEFAADQGKLDQALNAFFRGTDRDVSNPNCQLRAVLDETLQVRPQLRTKARQLLERSFVRGGITGGKAAGEAGRAAVAAVDALGSRLDRGLGAVRADIRDAAADMVQASGGGGAANS